MAAGYLAVPVVADTGLLVDRGIMDHVAVDHVGFGRALVGRIDGQVAGLHQLD